MAETIDAMTAAYRAAMHRLADLDELGFLKACLALGWGDMAGATPLAEALSRLAGEGSIDAAAALNVLAVHDRGLERKADQAVVALFRRNPAARDELVTEGLVIMLEEAAADMSMVPVVDPVTGEKRWRQP